MMIEVFKTNVQDPDDSYMLIDRIHKAFPGYEACFDLEDCDRILRVKCATAVVQTDCLIDLLKELGFCAEVLPDELLGEPDHLIARFSKLPE